MDSSSFAAIFGPPSTAPIPVDWDAVESWLGLRLPNDYKSLASAYGPLDVGEFIWVHTPCLQEERFEYANWLRETHRHCRISSRQAPPYEPPVLHPAPGGLLAWGMPRSTSYLFWDTAASEDPDRWPVVVFHQDAVYKCVKPWHSYEMPLLDMLSRRFAPGFRCRAAAGSGHCPRPPDGRHSSIAPSHGPRPRCRQNRARSGGPRSLRVPGWRH